MGNRGVDELEMVGVVENVMLVKGVYEMPLSFTPVADLKPGLGINLSFHAIYHTYIMESF